MSAEEVGTAVPWGDESSDAELITAARAGDPAAFGALYERHAAAARTVARQYTRSSADADDVVSDAFARVYTIVRGGGGPDVAFRAYLFTVVRRLAHGRVEAGRRVQPTDDIATFESASGVVEGVDDPALAGFERGVVAKAYGSLPERWQAVLWYTEIERLQPAQVAPLLGLTANGVAALAYRAREGLREAYLQQHLVAAPSDDCRSVNGKLGSYVRGGLAKRETAHVRSHLETCETCRNLVLELGDVNHGLRGIIAPLVLGVAGLGALGAPLPVGLLSAVGGGMAGSATAAGIGATAAGAGTAGSTATAGAGAGGALAGAGSAGGAVAATPVVVVGPTVAGATATGTTAAATTAAATTATTAAAATTAGTAAATTAAAAATTAAATTAAGTTAAAAGATTAATVTASGAAAGAAATSATASLSAVAASGAAGATVTAATATGATVVGAAGVHVVGVGAGAAGASVLGATGTAVAAGGAMTASGAATAAGLATASGATALAGGTAASGAAALAGTGGIGGLVAAIPGGVSGAMALGVVSVSLAVGTLAEPPARPPMTATAPAPVTAGPAAPAPPPAPTGPGGTSTTSPGPRGPVLAAPALVTPPVASGPAAPAAAVDPAPASGAGDGAATPTVPARVDTAPPVPGTTGSSGPATTTPLAPAALAAAPTAEIVLIPGTDRPVSITLTNTGQSEATDLRAALVLPGGAQVAGSGGDGGWRPCADDPADFCLPSLAGGASSELSALVGVAPEGTVPGVTTIGVDVDGAGLSFRGTVPVTVAATAPRLAVSGPAPAPLVVGTPRSVLVEVANLGQAPARDVVAAVVLPAGVRWTGGSTGPWSCTADDSGVSCTIAEIPGAAGRGSDGAEGLSPASLALPLVADASAAGATDLSVLVRVTGRSGSTASHEVPLAVEAEVVGEAAPPVAPAPPAVAPAPSAVAPDPPAAASAAVAPPPPATGGDRVARRAAEPAADGRDRSEGSPAPAAPAVGVAGDPAVDA